MLADQILLEHFQNYLDEHTQQWVCQHSPANCEEALRLAEAFAVSEMVYSWEKPVPSPGSTHPCKAEKRLNPIRSRPREMVCFQCERTEHFSRECPSSPMECWRPDSSPKGQTKRRKEMDISEPMDCSYASEGNSAMWSHPIRRMWVEHRPVKATLDSGYAQSLVQADLVPLQMVSRAMPVRMVCFHGETGRVKCRWIQL